MAVPFRDFDCADMEPVHAPQSQDDPPDAFPDLQATTGLTPRAYQLEMLEMSMRQNIIVAMATGSGKTLIAILRIQAELERCTADKLVWFCVPTVALAEQQYRDISRQLPRYQSRVLSGKDSCEFWTESTWTEVLKGMRIVVSTHAILRDALTHAFVKINQLALLVFDEAHSTNKDHAANKIMQDFYHPAANKERPFILGLTASPLINNKVGNLSVLESNLDAISRTPKLHQSELAKSVYKPELIQLTYSSNDPDHNLASMAMTSLRIAYDEYDFDKDPWVIKMRSDPAENSSKSLMKAIMKQKTWCREQLRNLYERAKRIAGELGPWATDVYIHQCIEKFRRNRTQSFALQEAIEDREKRHLQEMLDQIDNCADIRHEFDLTENHITSKVQNLINFLIEQDFTTFAGLIFVETRAEVAMLSQLLMLHPLTQAFAVSSFVGESASPNRKFALGELADIQNQRTTLDDLRKGLKNLVVTTNALEEGIDVSACNVVVCFHKPPNLKSFVQRRGRARQELSKYAIMLEKAEGANIVLEWQRLEAMMKQLYEDEMRQLEHLQNIENEEADGHREFRVEATGAKLSLSDAVSHLYHFCNTLPPDPYVDRVPMFFFEDHSSDEKIRVVSGKVVLPCSVDASVREACSKSRWNTEKNARRDAAFEAYVALYHAGLVNDNLLPKRLFDSEEPGAFGTTEKRPNIVEVDAQIDMWPDIAEQWHFATDLHQCTITVNPDGRQPIEMNMITPIPLPEIESFLLHWQADTIAHVTLGRWTLSPWTKTKDLAQRITRLLLYSVFSNRMNSHQDDFILLFVPQFPYDGSMEQQDWLKQHTGSFEASELKVDTSIDEKGLIRDLSQYGAPYILHGVKAAVYQDALDHNLKGVTKSSEEPCLLLEAKKFSKRTNLLHQTGGSQQTQRLGVRYLLADNCTIDRLPWRLALFASHVPSILYVVHKTMMVDRLCTGLLGPLNIQNRTLVATAITASSTCEPVDYQRLEFVGDSILKLSTSLALMAGNLIHDEGRLSQAKDHIVSNSSLSAAAIRTGLSRFILTKAFTGKKWQPLYISNLLVEQKKREMSTKTLADVVESLVGATMMDGGLSKALDCLQIFLPRVQWDQAAVADKTLYDHYDRLTADSESLFQTERLIGYPFRCKSLIMEAMTHASYRGLHKSGSYQRLEFLGDSILEWIVTNEVFHRDPPIPTRRLHLIRTALVNGDFLGYLCMKLSITIPRTETFQKCGPRDIGTYETDVTYALWQTMRHSNTSIGADQVACMARYDEQKDDITTILAQDNYYPWTLLARLQPLKPFSDIVESIIAAIWIDSHGSLAACTEFLSRLGLIPYLKRVLSRDDLALLHPKEELGQLADQEKVTYVLAVKEERGKRQLTCSVLMGERELASVEDGLSRMEIETKAADKACKVLRREGRRLGRGRNVVQSDAEEAADLEEEDEGETVKTDAEGADEAMTGETEAEMGGKRKRGDAGDESDEFMSAEE